MESSSLSQAGRTTLITYVLQSLPPYNFACFRVPSAVCKRMGSIVRSFWWGHDTGQRKIPLINWDTICKPKKEGGLGIKKFDILNQAMLAGQEGRIINHANIFLGKTLKVKYFPSEDLYSSKPKNLHTWIWKSILNSKHSILHQGKWIVGSGAQIPINHPVWRTRKATNQTLQTHLIYACYSG